MYDCLLLFLSIHEVPITCQPHNIRIQVMKRYFLQKFGHSIIHMSHIRQRCSPALRKYALFSMKYTALILKQIGHMTLISRIRWVYTIPQ
jgi:hypothetical protein